MKRFVFLFGVWVLMLSCTRDADEIVAPLPEPLDPVSPYAVSVEEALSALYAVLEQIDGNDETRSGLMRHAFSVGEVKTSDLNCNTRSELSDAENLLYIVSFGEGNGSAVLGADSRVEPVLAILDETVLTPEDFSNDTETDDIQSFVVNLITDSAVSQAAILPIDPVFPPSEPRLRRVIEDVVTDNTFCAPRLKTKWSQNSPYNDKAPMNSSGSAHCFAGCSMIAMGQFLYYMQLPNFNINGRYYDWSLLKECEYGSVPSAAARNEVAQFVYDLGIVMKANFQDDGTGAWLHDIFPLLGNLGFYAENRDFLDLDSAKSIVCNKGPVCVTGYQDDDRGHSWVIDGWDSYCLERFITVYNEANMVVSADARILKERTLYHLNMGWGGKCDGYYSYSTLVVDTSEPLDSDKIDTSIGDKQGTNERYIQNFKTIIY